MIGRRGTQPADREPAGPEEELQELRRMFTEDLVNIRSRLASLEQRMDEIRPDEESSISERRGKTGRPSKREARAMKQRFAGAREERAAASPAPDQPVEEKTKRRRRAPKQGRTKDAPPKS